MPKTKFFRKASQNSGPPRPGERGKKERDRRHSELLASLVGRTCPVPLWRGRQVIVRERWGRTQKNLIFPLFHFLKRRIVRFFLLSPLFTNSNHGDFASCKRDGPSSRHRASTERGVAAISFFLPRSPGRSGPEFWEAFRKKLVFAILDTF